MGLEEPVEIGGREIVGDPLCVDGASIALADRFRIGGVIEGDVDGDEVQDRVWVSSNPRQPSSCGTFVTVETDEGTYWRSAAPVAEVGSLQEPSINSLVPINDLPGSEIVIDVQAGASTQFVNVFTLGRDGLGQVLIDGAMPGPFSTGLGSLIPYGGSVGHIEAVDCSADGMVVMSAAIPSARPEHYDVERRYFAASGSSLVLQKDRTRRETVDAKEVGRLPEFAASPFGSCE